MKFTAVLAVLCAAVVVSAETNADRMARGLPPKSPARRATPVEDLGARNYQPQPSSNPNPCHNGSLECCDTVTECTSDIAHWIKDRFGVHVSPRTPIGFSCDDLTPFGLKHGSCKRKAVCCKEVHFGGRVGIDCTPVS